MEFPRRDFLKKSAAAIGAAALSGCSLTSKKDHGRDGQGTGEEVGGGLGVEERLAPAEGREKEFVRALLHEADGSPMDASRAKLLYARDLANDPYPVAVILAEGRARVGIPDEPIQLCGRLKVPGFGEVYCYADNGGKGYSKPETVELVVGAAQTRLRRVTEAAEAGRHAGIGLDPEFERRMALARRPFLNEQGTARIAAAYESLSNSLHAGERLAINVAKMRISRLKEPRKEFLFGGACAGWEVRGPAFVKQFTEAFNFSTGTWYTWKNPGDPLFPVDYARMEGSTNWLLSQKIVPKGFGYLYMARGATPEWIRPIDTSGATNPATVPFDLRPQGPPDPKRQFNPDWPYDKVKKLYAQVIEATTRKYHGRWPYVEVMNEAHDKANLWRMKHEQVLDMAKMAFDAARRGSPTMKRQMNHCCMWGEYAKDRNWDGTRRWSPYQFVKTCFDQGIDYEVIGLQLYYPQFDLFETDRMLDRFKAFGKPLHITEIATASQPGLDPESMRPKTEAPGWHEAWSEATQADWVEGIYTLCYSKSEFEAIGWWDFSDTPGHFWPFGGLLRKDMTPKPAYERLRKLQKDWGVAKV
jgi:endo-1,4-beta-xylanase